MGAAINLACGAAVWPHESAPVLPSEQSALVEQSGTFADLETNDDAYWNVRSTSTGIALALSMSSDGDVQAVLDRDTASAIAHALLEAVSDLG
jgi:hypothetical protein